MRGEPGAPLSPWTYTNPELFELEYEAFFLRRWQWVGHVGDLPEPDFETPMEAGEGSGEAFDGTAGEEVDEDSIVSEKGSGYRERDGQRRGSLTQTPSNLRAKLKGAMDTGKV